MLENALRPKLEKALFLPLAKALVSAKVSSTTLTLLAALLGSATLPAAAGGFPFLALLFLWLSGLCDLLDGTVARLAGAQSDRGAALDIVSDRLVECALLLGLFLVAPEGRALLCLLMLSSILLCVTSFLVVGIFSRNSSAKSFHYSPGLIERAEAFCFFSALLLFPEAFQPLALLFIALTLWTTAVRLYEFYKFGSPSS